MNSILLRVGGLLTATGLTLTLLLDPRFALLGGLLVVGGGILLALAMEPALADQYRHSEALTQPADSSCTTPPARSRAADRQVGE